MVTGGRRGSTAGSVAARAHSSSSVAAELRRPVAWAGGRGARAAAAAGMVAVGWPDRMADFFSGDVVRRESGE